MKIIKDKIELDEQVDSTRIWTIFTFLCFMSFAVLNGLGYIPMELPLFIGIVAIFHAINYRYFCMARRLA